MRSTAQACCAALLLTAALTSAYSFNEDPDGILMDSRPAAGGATADHLSVLTNDDLVAMLQERDVAAPARAGRKELERLVRQAEAMEEAGADAPVRSTDAVTGSPVLVKVLYCMS
jgi:hypothetical protein